MNKRANKTTKNNNISQIFRDLDNRTVKYQQLIKKLIKAKQFSLADAALIDDNFIEVKEIFLSFLSSHLNMSIDHFLLHRLENTKEALSRISNKDLKLFLILWIHGILKATIAIMHNIQEKKNELDLDYGACNVLLNVYNITLSIARQMSKELYSRSLLSEDAIKIKPKK